MSYLKVDAASASAEVSFTKRDTVFKDFGVYCGKTQ
jgi:hypothetical protein